MKLIISMMTTKELCDNEIQKASQIFSQTFKNYKIKTSQYKFDDRQYYEADIDLIGKKFTKKTLYQQLNKLICASEAIMDIIPTAIDFIFANDDTEIEIAKYEKDIDDIKDFGLFITNRTVADVEPYYSSEKCTAYVNLAFVSFGVY